jgi:hypothetical protein
MSEFLQLKVKCFWLKILEYLLKINFSVAIFSTSDRNIPRYLFRQEEEMYIKMHNVAPKGYFLKV